MLPLPRENQKVSPYFVFYLIHSTQIGVSILGFERYIAKDAGYDAWISIIISGVSINMLIWIIYQILNKGKNDLAAIHMDLFGKTVGRLMNLYFVVYFTLFAITILRTYLEVIQVWVFPQLNLWTFTPVFLLLMYSFIVGGFRVVTGLSFLSVIYGLPLILLFWFPLQQADFSNVFLKIDHNLTELLKGSKTMSLGFLGFEPLFLFYPFIKNAETSQKWAHFGVIFSILLYLTTALVTFFYFSKEQLTHTIWATLTLWKIVDLPFIERFEYVGIAIWVFVVIPNLCLTVWSAGRLLKQSFSIRQRTSLWITLTILYVLTPIFKNRQQIDLLNVGVGRLGYYTIYFYIPLLFVIQWMIYRVRKNQ